MKKDGLTDKEKSVRGLESEGDDPKFGPQRCHTLVTDPQTAQRPQVLDKHPYIKLKQ